MDNLFGQTLRAARLGYRWVPEIERFVRISGEQAPWRIDVRERLDRPGVGRDSLNGGYRVWWEPEDVAKEILSLLPRARLIGRDTTFFGRRQRR